MTWIGIDPGTVTGVAVWDGPRLTQLTSLPIHDALIMVRSMTGKVTVVFEDARLRRWYWTATAKQDRDRLMGAGSVRRDCAIWEDALTAWGIPWQNVAPKDNMTKLSAEAFRAITGWTGRTNEHMRDAAMLVYGR